MATFSALPDELLLLVGAFVTHPGDILHLSQSSQKIYRLMIPLLYKSVNLDYHAYRERSPHALSQIGVAQPFLAIGRLVHKLRSNALLCSTIRSLDIRVESGIAMENYGLSLLLPLLPALSSLNLDIRTTDLRYYQEYPPDPLMYNVLGRFHISTPFSMDLSPSSLAAALLPVRSNLRSLTIFSDMREYERQKAGIGSLRHFTALEYLDIQGTILFGQRARIPKKMTSLEDRLPLRLKGLQVRCYSKKWCTLWRPKEPGQEEVNVVVQAGTQLKVLLERFFSNESRPQSLLRNVTVWFSSNPHWFDYDAKRLRRSLFNLGRHLSSNGISLETRLICEVEKKGCSYCKALLSSMEDCALDDSSGENASSDGDENEDDDESDIDIDLDIDIDFGEEDDDDDDENNDDNDNDDSE